MINSLLPMTAQTPSCFGMPVYGSAFGTAVDAAQTTVVRERKAVISAVTVTGDFPGTSAWRPPNC